MNRYLINNNLPKIVLPHWIWVSAFVAHYDEGDYRAVVEKEMGWSSWCGPELLENGTEKNWCIAFHKAKGAIVMHQNAKAGY